MLSAVDDGFIYVVVVFNLKQWLRVPTTLFHLQQQEQEQQQLDNLIDFQSCSDSYSRLVIFMHQRGKHEKGGVGEALRVIY